MKKRFKLALLSALMTVASVLILGACTLNKTEEEIKAEYNLNASVTYYANGGCFNKVPESTEITLWMDASVEAYPFEIPSDNKQLNAQSPHQLDKGSMLVTRDRYIFDGWYEAVIDENTGKPAVDGKGAVVILPENKVNFSKPLAMGKEMHLVAKWIPIQKVEIHVVSDVTFTATVQSITEDMELEKDSNDVTVVVEKSVKNGDVVHLASYSTTESKVDLGSMAFPASNAKGATFVDFYFDEACTQVIQREDLSLYPTDEDGNRKIYAKYIAGDWTLLSTANDITTKLFKENNVTGNFYLRNDIDMGVLAGGVSPRASFAGTIIGNGHTISNLKVVVSSTTIGENGVYSIFGTLKSGAKISDLTMENWTMSVTTKPSTGSVSAYFFASNVDKGATLTFDKVTIKGGALSVQKAESCTITNVYWVEDATQENGGYWSNTTYLFGGVSNDQAFLSEYTGITFEQKPSLSIQGL